MKLPRLLALVVGVAASCSRFSGTDSSDALDGGGASEGGALEGGGTNACGDTTSDPKNCGTCGHACAATQFCAASSCEPGCAGRIIYVSNGGNDANDGCTLQSAKQTIGAAINYARVVGAVAHSIHACRGTYPEGPLTLAYPVSLMGGFDCASGLRPPDYGYPSFNPSSLTVLSSPAANDPQAIAITLTVAVQVTDAGADATPVLVDGVRVTAPPTGAAFDGIGVRISGLAPVTLSNDWISGGATMSTIGEAGSIGVDVLAGAAPEISHAKIEGGSGTCTMAGGYGSLGVFARADSGALYVHDSTLLGGSGESSGVPSIGFLRGAVPASTARGRLVNNAIDGGTGHATAATFASVGVNAYGDGDLDIVGNVISGGLGACDVDCNVGGILIGAPGAHLTIRNNRVYGGDAKISPLAPGGTVAAFYGLYIQGASSLDVSQNIIHPGNQLAPNAEASAEIAIELIAPIASATVDQNTIRILSIGVEPAIGIAVTGGPLRVAATNNLLLGGVGGSAETAFYTNQCESAFGAIDSNALVALSRVLNAPGHLAPGQCGGATAYTDLNAAHVRLAQEPMPPTFTNDVGVSPACSPGDLSAGACVTPAGCASTPTCVAGIVTSALSEMDFVQGSGAKLIAGATCRVATGGADLTALFPTDIFGAPRTAPISIGAAEGDLVCQ